MKIALTHAYSWPEVRRGAERIIHELSRSLALRGHRVTVFTTGSAGERRFEGGVRWVRFKRRFTHEPFHERFFAAQVLPALSFEGFDCVHSFGPWDCAASVRAGRLRGHRSVYTNLGNPFRSFWEGHHAAKAHRMVVERVDVYGCMSRYSLDALKENYGREGTLTPGGVHAGQFTPSEGRSAVPVVLFSAALTEPRKGGRALIQALDLLIGSVPDVRLWLSGPGDPGELLTHASARARDRIDVLGLGGPTEQAERYGRAWVTALPSKSDSFGLVVIESLACGTPVVVSDHAALPELVTEGITGSICPPDDPPALAAALHRSIELSSSPSTAASCRQAAMRFDWDSAITPMYEEIYGAPAERMERNG